MARATIGAIAPYERGRRAHLQAARSRGPIVITTERRCDASPATVHALLTDVDAWVVWSPHVASVEAPSRTIHPGWDGRTRAFFSPVATPMTVDEVRPGGGYAWHATVGPWRLDYDNAVLPEGSGSVLRFTARLSGPAAGHVERVVAPLSALGQRRRIARMARLAELLERRTA